MGLAVVEVVLCALRGWRERAPGPSCLCCLIMIIMEIFIMMIMIIITIFVWWYNWCIVQCVGVYCERARGALLHWLTQGSTPQISILNEVTNLGGI